ncbi:hypothetical protein F4810DRAFT_677289 [Camillea tinctor]|nr:hypothetical protein F4810DRAFT_677289 [Camillea tinctor]
MRKRVIDTDITILYEPDDDKKCVADIVFVHGLQGHPKRTWTYTSNARNPAKKSSLKRIFSRRAPELAETPPETRSVIFWPETILPNDCPSARIMTWGYDSKVINGFFKAANQNSFYTHANDLLKALDRVRIKNRERPLIFVMHSLGGIIVKQALLDSKRFEQMPNLPFIEKSTIGLVFLGTPHRGSDFAGWGKIASAVASAALFDVNRKNIKSLEANGEELMQLERNFGTIIAQQHILIHNFHESKGFVGITGLNGRVVEPWSASIGNPGRESTETINKNHMNMCRFSGEEDPGYKKVRHQLWEMIDMASQILDKTFVVNKLADNEYTLEGRRNSNLVPVKEEERMKILTWLSPLPYVDHHESAKHGRSPDTGDWVFERPEFQGLKTASNQGFLWIHGIMGAGKTKLISRIVDALHEQRGDGALNGCGQEGKTRVTFFYCIHGLPERSKHIHILSSLIRQLAEPLGYLPDKICKLYKDKSPEGAASRELHPHDYLAMLEAAISCYKEAWLILDALDECDTTSIEKLLETFTEIKRPLGQKVRIIISSRDLPSIRETLCHVPNIDISNEGNNKDDIIKFIKKRLEGSKHPPDLLHKIGATVLKNSKSSFQYAVHYLDQILPLAAPNIESALNKSPTTLQGLYSETFDEIKSDQSLEPYVMRAFKWLQSHNGSSSSQLLLAAISQHTVKERMQQYLINIDQLLTAGRFLLMRHGGLVRFSHESVREFVQNYFEGEPDYRDFEATVLLDTLLYYGPSEGLTPEIDALYKEAVQNWRLYVKPILGEKEVRTRVERFFETEPSPGYKDWLLHLARIQMDYMLILGELQVDFIFSPREWLEPQEPPVKPRILYSQILAYNVRVAFIAGCLSKAKSTLAMSSNIDEWGAISAPQGLRELWLGKPSAFFKAFDDYNYDDDREIRKYGDLGKDLRKLQFTYLHLMYAIEQDPPDPDGIANFLRHSRIAPPKCQQELAHLFLLYMCNEPTLSEGEAELAGWIFDNFDINEPLEYEFLCVSEDSFDIQQTLITTVLWEYLRNLEVSVVNVLYQPRIVEFLIKNGADVNFELTKGSGTIVTSSKHESFHRFGTPLIAAVVANKAEGADEIMTLLLRRGAEINQVASEGDYGTALIAACAIAPENLVQTLLEKGASVNILTSVGNYSTALIAACAQGRASIVQALLEKGADINALAIAGDYGTALIAACAQSNAGIIQTLLEKGASINILASVGNYGTAAIAACACKRRRFRNLKELLRKGAMPDVLTPGMKYPSAFDAAIYFNNAGIAILLLNECKGIVTSSLPSTRDEIKRENIVMWEFFDTPDQAVSLEDVRWEYQFERAAVRLSLALLYFQTNQNSQWLEQERQRAIELISYWCKNDNNFKTARQMLSYLGLSGDPVLKNYEILRDWQLALNKGPETVRQLGWEGFAKQLLGLLRDLYDLL